MTDGEDGLLAVNTGLVLQTLVEAVFTRVEKTRGDELPPAIAAVLRTDEQRFLGDDERVLEDGLRDAGYLARVVEAELFEPARQPAAWIPDLLSERRSATGSWADAVVGAGGDLARAEPLGKPSPDDAAAMSWRVPGPGGHVRHYLARRTIEDDLRGREQPVDGDPAELKRPWLYGFFVRACEETLPDGALLDTPAS